MSFIVCSEGTGNNRGQKNVWDGEDASTGGTGDSNISTGGAGFVTLQTLLKNITRRVTVAPGVGHNVNYRVKNNSSVPVAVTPTQTISDTDTFVTNDVEALLSALNGSSHSNILATMNFANEWVDTTPPGPAPSEAYYCWEYEVQGVGNDALSWYMIGRDFSNQSFPNSNGTKCFAAIVGDGGFLNSATTRARRQIPWPVSGTFKSLAIVWKNLTAGTSVQVSLEQTDDLAGTNLVDLLGPYTLANTSPTSNWQALTPSDTAAITAGKYLNWQINRVGGTGTAIAIVICLGFEP